MDFSSASCPVVRYRRNLVFKTSHTKVLFSKICVYKQERAHPLPELHKALRNFLKVWVTPSISHLERSTASVMGKSPGAFV